MRVIAANSAPCLRCYHCRRGQENLCDDLLFNNGAYADYMRIPGRIVVENMLEVPHSVDDQSAALAEPLACVLRGIHEMEVRTGDTAAVIGCGPIGLKFVDRKSTRLNSSHITISYAVFCLKKKKNKDSNPALVDSITLQKTHDVL